MKQKQAKKRSADDSTTDQPDKNDDDATPACATTKSTKKSDMKTEENVDTKSSKKKRDPAEPKRPLSGFMRFSKEVCVRGRVCLPVCVPVYACIVTVLWRALTHHQHTDAVHSGRAELQGSCCSVR